MNIAYVSNVVYPFVKGGAEKRIYEEGTRLVKRGHSVTVYGRHFWDGPKEQEFDGLTLRAVSPERELYAGDRRSIGEAVEFSKDLLRPLQRHRREHDVVVASVFPYLPVLTAGLVTGIARTPLVTIWHEVWGPYWNEYLGAMGPAGRAVELCVTRVPQYPVAVSGVTADRLAGIGPARESIAVVPNGIDADRIGAVEPVSTGFDVLFVGRLIEEKNVDALLQAFDVVAAEFDCRLGIVGDGPARETLERTAEDLHHRDRVSFLGFLDDYDEVLAQMRAATVFASPSRREGFGITLVEAMAADCTVVAVRHPQSAAEEVVGDAGFLTEPTVTALVGGLRSALQGERPQTQPTVAAKRYDWDRIAEQSERVYAHAVASYGST
ncbi:glycosyltransferase family 4 protein [Halobium salinum]|uniref:Glycosyltransferase family 4 protein n=1 Tax=Halobium salinum TaxID=1364940 RepID=A0ABD5P9X9_9EURY|nr:glycosyltransferase family 4 protein [Halobium salinum]